MSHNEIHHICGPGQRAIEAAEADEAEEDEADEEEIEEDNKVLEKA